MFHHIEKSFQKTSRFRHVWPDPGLLQCVLGLKSCCAFKQKRDDLGDYTHVLATCCPLTRTQPEVADPTLELLVLRVIQVTVHDLQTSQACIHSICIVCEAHRTQHLFGTWNPCITDPAASVQTSLKPNVQILTCLQVKSQRACHLPADTL